MSILQELTSSTYDKSELNRIQAFLLAESKALSDFTLKTWLGTGENQIAKRAAALLDDDLDALYAYYKSKPRPRDTVDNMRYDAIMTAYKKRHRITEAQDDELEVGDVVEVTGNVQFQDCIGEVERVQNGFAVVKIYSSKSSHSFHISDLTKIDKSEYEDHDDDDDDDEHEASSFFVVIHDQDESKSFIGEFEKDGRYWREHEVAGKPPYAWGNRFMSYLSPQDIMSWLHKDFKYYEVSGPFDSKHEAERSVDADYGLETLKESEELKALGRNIKKGKKPAEDDEPPIDDATADDDIADETSTDDASMDEPPVDDEPSADDVTADGDSTDTTPPDDAPETTTATTDTVPADDVTPEFKVGDIVKPNKGQHAGEPHEVVGIHPDGGLLIKPKDLDDDAIKYTAKSKTAKIRTSDVQIVESQLLKRGLLKAVVETRVDNGELTMSELLKLRNGLYEAGDLVGYRILVQAITEAKSGSKPNMRGVEAKLAAHAKSKIDREAKYGTLSPADQVSHENVRKRLLKDLSRERSKANCSESAVRQTENAAQRQQKYWDGVAKERKAAEKKAIAAKPKGPVDKAEAYWSKKSVKEELKFENPKGIGRKIFNKVMGIPSGKYKYAVGDMVSYEMNPIDQKNGRGTSKVVALGDGHHYKLANGAIVNQNEIKKLVKEDVEGKKLFRISCTDDNGEKRSMLLHANNEAACKSHCSRKGYTLKSVKDVTGEVAAPTRRVREEKLVEISNSLVNKAKLAGLDKAKKLQSKLDKDNDNKFGSQRRDTTPAEKAEFKRLQKFNLAAEKRLNKSNVGPSEEEKHAEYNRKRATGGVGIRKD